MIQASKTKQKTSFLTKIDIKDLQRDGIKTWPPRKFVRGQKNKWLSSLLKTIRRSQKQLAAMVGVTPNTIANVMTGRSPLNQKLAQKIYVATGAYHWPYFRGDDKVYALDGTTYSKAEFENWLKNYSDSDEKRVGEFFNYASDTLQVLLNGAARCKLKNHLPALRQSFLDWCVESYKNFDLEKPIKEFLEGRKYIQELTMNYQHWRDPHPVNVSLARRYEFKDDPRKLDHENLTLRYETRPGFFACGNMKKPPGGINSETIIKMQ